LLDGGVNNYKPFNSTIAFDRGSKGEKGEDCVEDEKEEKDGKEERLAGMRTLSEELEASMEANPDDEELRIAYYSAVAERESLLKTLLEWAADENDYDKTEELLLGENTNAALRDLIGLRIRRKNYEGAQVLLETMPVLEQDDQWFKDIADVNLDMMQTEGKYELTSEQEEKMLTIANTPYSIMHGYACAVLSICKGYTCDINVDQEVELEERKSTSPLQQQIKLYPNPTANIVTVEYAELQGETLSLEIIDVSGKLLKSMRYVNSGSFNVNCVSLPNGTYQLRLYHTTQMLGNLKLTIKH
jgi:hypothetical protein